MRMVAKLCLITFVFVIGSAVRSQESPPARGKIVLLGRSEFLDGAACWIKAVSRDGSVRILAQVELGVGLGRVSPDATRLALISTRDDKTGVWLLSTDGRERSLLVETSPNAWIGGWSPDSKRIIYGEGGSGNRSNV